MAFMMPKIPNAASVITPTEQAVGTKPGNKTPQPSFLGSAMAPQQGQTNAGTNKLLGQ